MFTGNVFWCKHSIDGGDIAFPNLLKPLACPADSIYVSEGRQKAENLGY